LEIDVDTKSVTGPSREPTPAQQQPPARTVTPRREGTPVLKPNGTSLEGRGQPPAGQTAAGSVWPQAQRHIAREPGYRKTAAEASEHVWEDGAEWHDDYFIEFFVMIFGPN